MLKKLLEELKDRGAHMTRTLDISSLPRGNRGGLDSFPAAQQNAGRAGRLGLGRKKRAIHQP